LARLEKEGMKILNCRMLRLNGPLLKEHYFHIAHLPFFPEIETFMSSGPVIAVALQGAKAIERVRELLGPTDSTKAPKGTIRTLPAAKGISRSMSAAVLADTATTRSAAPTACGIRVWSSQRLKGRIVCPAWRQTKS
jgi:nucleoside diphosphate kinase